MKMQKRGQAATEFLTTYGWAILILAAVVIVIFNLNLFSPKAPNVCNSANPIFCSDVRLSMTGGERLDPKLSLIMSSSGTSTKQAYLAKVIQIKLESPISDDQTCNSPLFPKFIQPNQNTEISCESNSWTNKLKENDRFSGYATVSYYLQETDSLPTPLEHKVKVYFSGTIEA